MSRGKELKCKVCEPRPGVFIPVEDVKDPHCIKCGRELFEPAKEFAQHRYLFGSRRGWDIVEQFIQELIDKARDEERTRVKAEIKWIGNSEVWTKEQGRVFDRIALYIETELSKPQREGEKE